MTNPRHFNKHDKRLRRAQKALSRKMKGSCNREKARRKVAKIYAKITDSLRVFWVQGDKDKLWQIISLGVGANGRSPLQFGIPCNKSHHIS
ncbi:MAG: hypothetical protein EA395_14855 [Phormidium sp. GEM2.Bin31]|nr:MAG: hypothetical protein EA395_14855 [Phormidium sp. GEM2.Bin31]